jgi:hypothetical protein
MSWLLSVALLASAGALYIAYLGWYFWWERRETSGLGYFGRSAAERRAVKRRIRRYSTAARPVVRALAIATRRSRTMPRFEFEGVSGPPGISSAEVFARAKRYVSGPQDVFVATQMRCGTTWMQQVVYQILTRGDGDFDGHARHLYAFSPWIDGLHTVSIDEAPLFGQPPRRIVKTHLPADLCPDGDEARFIYVARHPVTCFGSIVEFNRAMLGPLLPTLESLAAWFCSDQMYWRPWPAHVAGWWDRAAARRNVLIVHYEDMTQDFAAVRDRVAAFLGCALTADEARRIDERCSFRYMKAHEATFEMAPPTMFSVGGGQFLARGRTRSADDLSAGVRDRVVAYCRESLRGRSYPVNRCYPDLPAAAQRSLAAS